MERLQKKDPNHPAAKAYFKYRNGPEDTVRSVLMTVNARMQPFDNPDLLEIFCDNEIPLDEFGSGVDGDGKTKSNLFMMIHIILFRELFIPFCFRNFTGRQDSLMGSFRWMWGFGWMNLQISKLQQILIKSLLPAVLVESTACQFFSLSLSLRNYLLMGHGKELSETATHFCILVAMKPVLMSISVNY